MSPIPERGESPSYWSRKCAGEQNPIGKTSIPVANNAERPPAIQGASHGQRTASQRASGERYSSQIARDKGSTVEANNGSQGGSGQSQSRVCTRKRPSAVAEIDCAAGCCQARQCKT